MRGVNEDVRLQKLYQPAAKSLFMPKKRICKRLWGQRGDRSRREMRPGPGTEHQLVSQNQATRYLIWARMGEGAEHPTVGYAIISRASGEVNSQGEPGNAKLKVDFARWVCYNQGPPANYGGASVGRRCVESFWNVALNIGGVS